MSASRALPLVAAAACLLAASRALAQDEDAVAALERRTAEIARAAAPSIVGVTAVTEPPPGPQLVLPGLTFAPLRCQGERLEANGFVVDAAGVVATTFEIARESARFELRFGDGTTREARYVGSDEPFHVAVLRFEPHDDARPLTASSDDVAAGTRALGWLVSAARRGEPDTVLATVRPASCDDSSYDRWLAACITLREGSGGSPLLTREGRLLGMAVGSVGERSDLPAVARARSTLFVRGGDVLAAAREIALTGRVRRPRLGVLLEGRGNRVDQLVPGGPAEKAGVREGDRVVDVAGTAVANAAQVTRALVRRRAGEIVTLQVVRDEAPLALKVALDEATLPAAPVDPPLPGTILEVGAEDGAQTVTVTALEADSAYAAAGLRVGDRVVQVDGLDVLRFLARHRVRPASAPPAKLLVRRDGADVVVAVAR